MTVSLHGEKSAESQTVQRHGTETEIVTVSPGGHDKKIQWGDMTVSKQPLR
jgi:hypothetical protein